MPALPALVTAADMEAYGYEAVSAAVLLRASTRARRYLRQQITPGTSTITVRGIGPWRLPQRPVVEVTAVVDADDDAVEWELVGQVLSSDACPPLSVTYGHGFDPLPDDLVEAVCGIAARLGGQPAALATGVRTEQAGGEAVTWGAEAFASVSGLTPGEAAALDAVYPRLPPMPIRLI